MNREIIVLRDALQNIIDIGYDYDGYGNSLSGCKSLIDELVCIANNALNKKQSPTYLKNGDIVNVFDEVVGNYNPNNLSCENCKLNYFDKNREDY